MFDLVFNADKPQFQEDGWNALRGQTIVGDHRETFFAPLEACQRRDYECDWIEAAEHVLKGADRTAFIPSAFKFWRPMWSDGADVCSY